MKRFLPIAIIVIVLLAAIAGGWILLRSSQQSRKSANPTPDPALAVQGAEPPHIRGNPNAPVTVEEFGDFQCPSCGVYYPELKKIEAEFGDRLRVVFREYPLLPMHEHALIAAQVAEAAGLQGKFWEMHDKLYRNQKDWSEAGDPLPWFIAYAKELGLKIDQFTSDLQSNQIDQRIMTDIQRGTSLGVTGTPTVFLDSHLVRYEATNAEGLRRGINILLEQKAGS